MPESGLVIAAGNDRRVVEVTQSSARCPVSYYALEGDDTHGVSPEWLGATGTIIDGMQYINRGYERWAERLRAIGASAVQSEPVLASAMD